MSEPGASVQLKEMGCMRNKGKKLNVNQSILNLSYLEHGSFLMSEISKGLGKNTVTFIFYIVNLQTLIHSTNMVYTGLKFLIL